MWGFLIKKKGDPDKNQANSVHHRNARKRDRAAKQQMKERYHMKDITKLIEIKEITALLIRPHWKQIAIVKPAERKECYQLAIEHAEELFSNNHTLQHHKQEYRKKQAGSSKQPPQFDDRLSREADKNYRKQYGAEFDTELNELLGTSK